MIDLNTLPKNPEDALEEILKEALKQMPRGDATASRFLKTNRQDILFLLRAATIASQRVTSPQVKEISGINLQLNDAITLEGLIKNIGNILDALIVEKFDQHFLDNQCIEDYDVVELDESDKSEIRELLAKARKLTENAGFLSEDHKRRIIHRIAGVENELFQKVSGFKAFLVAAADVSNLVKKFGKDAKPIAEAIQTARTITERKVEGYIRIEEEEKPKRLPKPESK